MTTCEITERSARGYCPDDPDAVAEYCSMMPDASFCSGPSDQGVTLIPPLALERDADGNPVDVSCELDGTCDDSFTDECVEQGLAFDYDTGTCATTVTVPAGDTVAEAPTLPATGVDGTIVLVLGLVALAVGLWLLGVRR